MTMSSLFDLRPSLTARRREDDCLLLDAWTRLHSAEINHGRWVRQRLSSCALVLFPCRCQFFVSRPPLSGSLAPAFLSSLLSVY